MWNVERSVSRNKDTYKFYDRADEYWLRHRKYLPNSRSLRRLNRAPHPTTNDQRHQDGNIWLMWLPIGHRSCLCRPPTSVECHFWTRNNRCPLWSLTMAWCDCISSRSLRLCRNCWSDADRHPTVYFSHYRNTIASIGFAAGVWSSYRVVWHRRRPLGRWLLWHLHVFRPIPSSTLLDPEFPFSVKKKNKKGKTKTTLISGSVHWILPWK